MSFKEFKHICELIGKSSPAWILFLWWIRGEIKRRIGDTSKADAGRGRT